MQTHDFHHFFLKKKQLKEKHLLMSVPRKKSIFRVFSLSFLLNMTYNLCLSKKHKNNDARNYRNFKFYLTKVCFFFFLPFQHGSGNYLFPFGIWGGGQQRYEKNKIPVFRRNFFFFAPKTRKFFPPLSIGTFFQIGIWGGVGKQQQPEKKKFHFFEGIFFFRF